MIIKYRGNFIKKKLIKTLTLGIVLMQFSTVSSWAEVKGKLRLRNYDAEVAQELNEMEKKEDLAEYFKQYLNGEISKDELDIKVDSLDVDSSLIYDAKKEAV